MRPKPLTRRQRAILRYVFDHREEHGWAPTVREIGEHFGIRSTTGVVDHLSALERKGMLVRDVGKPRCLALTDRGATELAGATVTEDDEIAAILAAMEDG